MAEPKHPRGSYTIADWLAQPEGRRVELIDGAFVEKAGPSSEHVRAQWFTSLALGFVLGQRMGGPHDAGGWWIGPEMDIVLDGNGFRPDFVGWRLERFPPRARKRPVTVRPDWICEILSPSNSKTDTVTKLHLYHHAGVPHYWLLDPSDRTLTVYRHMPDGYLVAQRAEASEYVRAEPFDAIEIPVGWIFGDELPEDEPG